MRVDTQHRPCVNLRNPSPPATPLLGKAFFRLSHDLEASDSFESVAKLLGEVLPNLVHSDASLVIETEGGPNIREVHGNCEIARLVHERLPDLNRLLPDHPLMSRMDFRDPGELGMAVSDFVSAEKYRQSEFNRMIHDGLTADDAIIGKLAACCRRTTFLVTCRREGVFTPEEREIFDAVLFTARAVLGRIGSMGVEASVRKFLMGAAGSPVAIFAVRPDAEVFPLSHEAVRLSEKWWGEDEATHPLGSERHQALRSVLQDAWVDPVTAAFKETELDLGGGTKECHALPKADGEILVFMPVSGHLPSGDEALKAVLTRRQREIMEWIAEGKTSAEAAIILDISPRTVEKHLEAVFQRLGVENRISAVRRFLDLKAGHAM